MVKLDHQWSRCGAPEDGLATLGVACNGAEVAAVGEDGGLVVLEAERGGKKWRTQSREPALYAVAWWDANTLAVGGTVVSFWDVRASGGKKPVLTLTPSPGAQMHLGAALLCVSPEAPQPRRLAAGATDGTVSVWDVRASASLLSRFVAHRSDVWDVQLLGSGGGGGEPGLALLSCGSDGCLYEWALDTEPSAKPLGCAPPPERRALVQLALPINSLEQSPQGMLAAASDAQVLTFVDIR
jgi:WD40 repeat protein